MAGLSYATSQDFDLSADALWSIVSDFGDLSWLGKNAEYGLDGEGVGAVRWVSMRGAPPVREELRALREDDRSITYALVEGKPMPIDDYVATMRVVDLGDGRSRLEWSSTFSPDGVEDEKAVGSVQALYTNVLASMKALFEAR